MKLHHRVRREGNVCPFVAWVLLEPQVHKTSSELMCLFPCLAWGCRQVEAEGFDEKGDLEPLDLLENSPSWDDQWREPHPFRPGVLGGDKGSMLECVGVVASSEVASDAGKPRKSSSRELRKECVVVYVKMDGGSHVFAWRGPGHVEKFWWKVALVASFWFIFFLFVHHFSSSLIVFFLFAHHVSLLFYLFSSSFIIFLVFVHHFPSSFMISPLRLSISSSFIVA